LRLGKRVENATKLVVALIKKLDETTVRSSFSSRTILAILFGGFTQGQVSWLGEFLPFEESQAD